MPATLEPSSSDGTHNRSDEEVDEALRKLQSEEAQLESRTRRAPHELMIERAPIKLESPGKPDEMAAQGMIQDMKTGQTGQMTVQLKPGNYVLFCNVSGHYAAGQHIPFTVTAH